MLISRVARNWTHMAFKFTMLRVHQTNYAIFSSLLGPWIQQNVLKGGEKAVDDTWEAGQSWKGSDVCRVPNLDLPAFNFCIMEILSLLASNFIEWHFPCKAKHEKWNEICATYVFALPIHLRPHPSKDLANPSIMLRIDQFNKAIAQQLFKLKRRCSIRRKTRRIRIRIWRVWGIIFMNTWTVCHSK